MPVSVEKLVEIVHQATPSISAMGIRRLSSVKQRIDIEDVIQITSMKAFAHREAVKSDDAETTLRWVRNIGYNTVKSVVTCNAIAKRSTKRERFAIDVCVESPVLEDKNQLLPEATIAIQEDFAAVEAALKELPPNQAKAVRMLYLEFASYDEIATACECSILAARSLVSRGLKAIRTILDLAA